MEKRAIASDWKGAWTHKMDSITRKYTVHAPSTKREDITPNNFEVYTFKRAYDSSRIFGKHR